MLLKEIEAAVEFLYNNQIEDGSFPESVYIIKEKKWRKTPPTIFSASIIANSVSEVLKYKDVLNIPIVEKCETIRKKTLDFFIREMKMPGLWKFGTSTNEQWKNLPFDMDDTCCVSYLLKDYHPYIHFGVNKSLITKNRNEEGLFYTWFLPPSQSGRNNIDSVVNVNVILYLGEIPQTENAINYICDLINSGREEGSFYYYKDKRALYYFLSRAGSSGVNGFSKCSQAIIDKLTGAKPNREHLMNAFEISAMLNLNYVNTEFYHDKVKLLLDAQQANGSWPISPFYQGGKYPNPVSIYNGTESVSTAVCLETLVKVESLRIQ